MYKLKQFVYDTSYIVICPSKDTILNFDSYYSEYHSIPSMFRIEGYGKKKRIAAYSFYRRNQFNNLEKSGWVCNVTIARSSFNTVKQLSPFECSKIGVMLREKGYVYNKKTSKLITLT